MLKSRERLADMNSVPSHRKKKILHIYKDFNVYNGLTEILTILAKSIDHKKYDFGVCVFRYEGNDFGQKFEEYGGKIYNLDIPDKLINQGREIFSLYRFFRSFRPDVVHTHVLKSNMYGVLAAKLAKVPVVIATEMTLKDTAPSRMRRIRDRLLHPFLNQMISKCDTFMVTSKFIQQEWYKEKYANKFHLIYPPFNLDKLEAAQENGSDLTLPDGPKICYVGRLSEEKGVRFLLSAAESIIEHIKDAKLIIVGTGPLEDELKSMINNSDLLENVIFLGYVDNVFKVLKQVDVFVLPSRSEGCPISVLEAMSMGLPVVATNVGGTPELVVDSETGILVPYNDFRKLGEAIVEVLKNRQSSNSMGLSGKERAFRKFHQNIFVRHLEEMYDRLLEEKTN